MRELINQHHVLAVIGNVGTPTAIVAIPIAIETKTPFFGAFTGAGVLRRTPPDRYVINFRASYAEETAAMVDGLIESGHLKPEEVAFFTQRDAYGDSGFAGGIAALKRHGLTNENAVAHVRYERNTLAVEKALAELLARESLPKAIIMVGAYAPCAAFIRQARENDLHAIFLNVSFVGSASLANALGPTGEGVIVTQVVPHFDSALPLVREYRAAQQAVNPNGEFSFGSLEGYIAARILCRALAHIPGVPDREKTVDALLSLEKFDLGLGEDLRLAPEEHQASHRIWPTVLHDGRFIPFEWQEWEKKTPANP
jgi:ABC-type branched-subunit amino acid transport system substrate-binding protein